MFQLIVQAPFAQRLDGTRVLMRNAGDHITDAEHVVALRGNPHCVQIWVDDPPPEPEPAEDPKPEPLKALVPPVVAKSPPEPITQTAALPAKA